MMKLLTLLALLVACLSGVKGECIRYGTRCLEYTVLETHEGYEVREYPSIVWVSATAEAKSKMDVSGPLIKMLYTYLGGGNDKKQRMNMTVPVRTKKVANGATNSYTVSIFLTPEQSEDPPVPTNCSVTVTREPSTVYVVRSFGGHARQDTIWDNQARLLKDALADDGSVDTSYYFMSVYDSPWRETNRLNDVWMVKNT